MKLAKVRKIGIGLGTAATLTVATAFGAQAGCVFNGSGKVIGAFGGDTKSEFDLNGRKGARMSRGGFSVGRSDSRGLMVFGSRRNMIKKFGSLQRAWSVGCLKRRSGLEDTATTSRLAEAVIKPASIDVKFTFKG